MAPDTSQITPLRARLTSDERRRQLLGIGLRMLVDKPIQDLSIDAVAAEAGISRGLLFHYFPTKTDYYDAVIAAALRRVLRTLKPDAGVTGDAAIRQIVERFYTRVERRRGFYLALVFGNGTLSLGSDAVETHRMTIARLVADAHGMDDSTLVTVHAWVAYVEDRAVQWSGASVSERPALSDEVAHCAAALEALAAIDRRKASA